MRALNPLNLPLNQNALIEASAGTGKTYTITTLYLRAILGLIDDSENLHPTPIDQLLVVTFTKAATQELKERVRRKLKEAQHAFVLLEAGANVEQVDPNLLSVLYSYIERSQEAHPIISGYRKVSDSITILDDAAIFTIHGFCQRALNQFAFETQTPFEQTFETDNLPYLQQAFYDFWRDKVVPLDGVEFGLFSSLWSTPKAFLKELRSVIDKPLKIEPQVSQAQYDELLSEYLELPKMLHEGLVNSDFIEILRNTGINKRKKTFKAIDVLQKVANLPVDDKQVLAILTDPSILKAYSASVLSDQSSYVKNVSPIDHPLMKVFERAHRLVERLNVYVHCFWLADAKNAIEKNSALVKQDQFVVTPDDLLLQLFGAIQQENGSRTLIDALRSRYPIAFIDEFQDTDPIQYAIFEAIYGMQTANPSAMLMIGDPKQAIYKFRGADIFTYIKAKSQLPDSQCFTLENNYRSHPELIASVNHFFQNSHQPFDHDAIPFIEVGAGNKNVMPLLLNGKPLPKFTVVNYGHETDPLNEGSSGAASAEARGPLANWMANDILKMLINDVVAAGDIAVLVRTGKDAKIVQKALDRRQIKSVFLSKDSVFASEMARDLLRIVQAIHSAGNERRLKTAVSTQYFGLSLTEQLNLQADDHAWYQILVSFERANQLWQRRQIAAAIEHIMDTANSVSTLRKDALNFERHITDHRHLMELLQQEAMQHSSLEPLVVWFTRMVHEELEGESALQTPEDNTVRLESDSNLVQIVTMHSSKGLEYPVVYIPFATDYRQTNEPIYYDERVSSLTLAPQSETAIENADKERLAEDTRLLYVAMTRAKQRLVMGSFNFLARSNSKNSSVHKTAFGRLVLSQLSQVYKPNQWHQALASKFASNDELLFINNESIIDAPNQYFDIEQPLPSLTPQVFNGNIKRNWQILSYSSIVGHQEHFVAGMTDEADNLDSDNKPDVQTAMTSVAPIVEQQPEFQFTFPKGANAGSCLHYMFEHLDFMKPVVDQQLIIENALTRFGLPVELTAQTVGWLQDVLNTRLPDQLIIAQDDKSAYWSLSMLNAKTRLDEMEFHLQFSKLDSEILSHALQMCGFSSASLNRQVLEQQDLQGLIKGFIDLIAVVNEQYFIVDYKSNHLGDSVDDYHVSNLELSMSDHNYHLQLLLYSYALHRWLGVQLNNYSYDTHIAGGLYLFIRGMSQSHINKGVYGYKVPSSVIEYLDNALLDSSKEASLHA